MYLSNLGGQSRKTGIRPKTNLKTDKYGMEDVDEFFEDDEDDRMNKLKGQKLTISFPRAEEVSKYKSTISQPFNNIARKINFNQEDDETFNLPSTSTSSATATTSSVSNKKSPVTTQQSPLRSPLPEQDYDYNQFDVEEDYGDITEEDRQPSPPPPPSVPKSNTETKSNTKSSKAASSFTKKMALGKTKKLPSSFDSANTTSVTEYFDEEEDDDDDRDYGESQQDSIEDSMMDSTFNDYSQPSSNIKSKTRRKIIKESPLPSPPPDNPNGLRRSKRTRIKPLAFWRNERIIYSKDLDYDDEQDTTLARDIHNIPLQLIKEVVHIPDNETVDNSRSPNSTTGAAASGSTKRRLNRKRTYKQSSVVAPTDYDYESDPEISGSEWFKEDNLLLEVNDNGESRVRKIAYNHKGGNYVKPTDDNYLVASLFDEDKSFFAGGMLQLPVDGFKPPVTVTGSTYMFNVMKGLIQVTLNENMFVVTKGCKVQIPEGNEYSLRNIGQGDAYLFFVQIRKPEEIDTNW